MPKEPPVTTEISMPFGGRLWVVCGAILLFAATVGVSTKIIIATHNYLHGW